MCLSEFLQDYIALGGPRRKKLSAHILGGLVSLPNMSTDSPTQGITKIDNINDFKKGLGLFPLPEPFISVRLGTKPKLSTDL